MKLHRNACLELSYLNLCSPFILSSFRIAFSTPSPRCSCSFSWPNLTDSSFREPPLIFHPFLLQAAFTFHLYISLSVVYPLESKRKQAAVRMTELCNALVLEASLLDLRHGEEPHSKEIVNH